MRLLLKMLCVSAVAITPLVARADSLDYFTLNENGKTVSWTLPSGASSPSTSPHFAIFFDVPVIFDGTSEIATYIEFPTLSRGGGVAVDIGNQNPYFYALGPQVFTGQTTMPNFLLSPTSFALTGPEGAPVSLSITPEPSTLWLLASGAIGLAGVARRKVRGGTV